MTVNALSVALSGLRAAQAQVGVISANIANAGTEGYTRKILPQQNFAVNGESLGVQTLAMRCNINTSLQYDLYAQTSLSSYSTASVKYLDQIQTFHGDPNDARSMANTLQGLNNDFISLADNPTNNELLNQTMAHAIAFADKVHDLSALYTKMRNDVQNEMQESINKIKSLLNTIVSTNSAIGTASNTGKSAADAEDQRDQAIKELSKEMDISYYKLGDGAMVIQTNDGRTVLADYTVRDIVFTPSTIGVNSVYPTNVAGVFVDNPTTTDTVADTDLTSSSVGGRLGALIELRDTTLPQYQAELDEFAQKLSQRFDEQGLRLFTNAAGQVPVSVDPPTNTGYSGYAYEMQVNQRVQDDINLLRLGTDGETLPTGSALVIDRVVNYTFGLTRGESGLGDVDLDATGTALLFTTLGLDTTAKIQGIKNIQALGSLDSSSDIVPGLTDTFRIQIRAAPAVDITIAAGHTATDLVNTINTAVGASVASISATGRLVLESDENIILSDVTLGPAGFEALGLSTGTTTAQNPSFTIQLEDGLTTTVDIAATDTSTQLLAKLNAVAGVNAALDANGYLSITTDYGAKIKLTDVVGGPVDALGININQINHQGFRTTNLGPGANITSQVSGADSLISYGQRIVANQASDASIAQRNFETAETYRASVDTQLSNDSGVSIDEEMGNLVAMQRLYGANARMMTTALEMLETLINAVL